MKVLLVGIPVLFILGGTALLLWHMKSKQKSEKNFHDRLVHAIQIHSHAIKNNGDIPPEHTCKGKGISPPLRWSGVPDSTRSLVLLMTDDELPYANLKLFKIVHWVLYNIPPEIRELPVNISHSDFNKMRISLGKNWSRETNYYPPCPLYGRHRYAFRIYALNVDTIQPEKNNRAGVLKAMQDHILAFGELHGFAEK